MNRISDLYGRRIYNDESGFQGTINDVLIDPTQGKIKFLVKRDPSSILGRDEKGAKAFIRENFIPFEKVKAVGDIVLIR